MLGNRFNKETVLGGKEGRKENIFYAYQEEETPNVISWLIQANH